MRTGRMANERRLRIRRCLILRNYGAQARIGLRGGLGSRGDPRRHLGACARREGSPQGPPSCRAASPPPTVCEAPSVAAIYAHNIIQSPTLLPRLPSISLLWRSRVAADRCRASSSCIPPAPPAARGPYFR
jgi:hypothetical protein